MSNRTAPSELWELAKSLVRTLYSIYGQPQEIAAQGAVDRKTYTWLIVWLHACETLLRRLLLIEARALNVPPASCRQTNAAGRMPAVRARQPFSLNPDDWRVSFRLLDRRRLAGMRRCGPARTPAVQEGRRTHPAVPLAFRAEALFRVCKNPLPYARRLARLIARIPKHLARILAPPHKRKRKSGEPPNVVEIIGHEAWAQIAALCPNTS